MHEDKRPHLGCFLRKHRLRLDPAAFGYVLAGRRTPGLRREEVARCAGISPTWYAWLEQGRGGAPSVAVLDRIATILMLTHAEHEELFRLGRGEEINATSEMKSDLGSRLQKVVDAFSTNPAFLRTAAWDVVAWNHAAAKVMNFGSPSLSEPSILQRTFGASPVKAGREDWGSAAAAILSSVRKSCSLAGMDDAVTVADELMRSSDLFSTLWDAEPVLTPADAEVSVDLGAAGVAQLELADFPVLGRPDLALVVCLPVTNEDKRRIAMQLGPIDD